VVANQTFTRQVFPNKNPVGEWLRIDGKLRQIVRVAEGGPSNELQEDREPFLWLPYSQAPRGGEITLMAETATDPETLARTLRTELKRLDPRAELLISRSLRRQVEVALAPDRLIVGVTGGLGIFGVLLTAAGLFGVLQYAVTRRTRELSLRIALGARSQEIQRMVLTESVRIAACGIPVDLALLGAAGYAVRSWLLGITLSIRWFMSRVRSRYWC
jgi:hypothetical protein